MQRLNSIVAHICAANESLSREDFKYSISIQTRWNDNDMYGHVNNVAFYSYFDTIVNKFLQDECSASVTDPAIGLVVHSECNYYESISFPEIVVAGLRVSKLGKSSITYSIGIFKEGGDKPVAVGVFVHVYVDANTRKPVAIPEKIQHKIRSLLN